jgi:hypothetical protein
MVARAFRLEFILPALGIAAALLATLSWLQPPASGDDLWWHLASGREIWALGGPPSHDTHSFTFSGREWMNHEWLWDAAYWRLYAAHPQSVAWFQLGVALATFAVVGEAARRTTHSIFAAGLSMSAGAATAYWFIDIRPHLFTLLFLSLILLLRDVPISRWLWPPMMVLWANVHGGFVFGVGVLGLLVVTRIALASWQERTLRLPVGDCIALGLCLVAWLLNPWGFSILEYPAEYLDSTSPYRNIVEWHAPPLSFDPRNFSGRFHLFAGVACIGLVAFARREPFLAALQLITLIMALTSRRFIPLFVVSSIIPIAMCFAALRVIAIRRWPALDSRFAYASTALAAAALGLWLIGDVRFTPDLLGRWTASDVDPGRAVRYLNALGPPRRILNDYTWGGYLMLHAPDARVFIDGRANTLYDDAHFLNHRALRRGDESFADRLSNYPADAALLPRGAAFATALTRLSEPWRVVYEDDTAVILLPPDSPLLAVSRPEPEAILGSGWQSQYPRIRDALLAGDRATVIRELEAGVRAAPLRVRAYAQLALLYAMEGDAAALQRSIDAGLRALPRRAHELHGAAGLAYLFIGDEGRALDAFRRGLPGGPFGSLEDSRSQLSELEAKIQERRAAGFRSSVPNP